FAQEATPLSRLARLSLRLYVRYYSPRVVRGVVREEEEAWSVKIRGICLSSPAVWSGKMSSAALTAGLEIRLFGPITVRLNGAPLPPLRTRKGQWFMALLALRHDRDVERSWLVARLWPDSPESQGFYNLRRSLSDLRRALGEAA